MVITPLRRALMVGQRFPFDRMILERGNKPNPESCGLDHASSKELQDRKWRGFENWNSRAGGGFNGGVCCLPHCQACADPSGKLGGLGIQRLGKLVGPQLLACIPNQGKLNVTVKR